MHSRLAKSTGLRFFSVITALALLSGVVSFAPGGTVRAASTVQLTIHYYRPDGQYTLPGTCSFPDSPTVKTCGWNLWIWDSSANGNGTGYAFTAADPSFTYNGVQGVVATLTVPCTTCTQMGFIIRQSTPTNEWANKDTASNRFVSITNGKAEVWVDSGDSNNYYSLADALNALAPKIKGAYLDGPKSVTVSLSEAVTFDGKGNGFVLKDATTGKAIRATSLSDASNYPGLTPVVAGSFQHLFKGDTDWNPNDPKTRMKQVSGDLYEKTINFSKAGTYQYRIAYPNWSSSYPSANVTLDVLSPGPITFDYTPSTNGVYDSVDNSGAPLPPSDAGWQTALVTVKLKRAPNVRDSLTISSPTFVSAPVIPRDVLNASQYFFGGQLGAIYSKDSTTFRVWTPTASNVTLSLYNSEAGPLTRTVQMAPYKHGTWQAKVAGSLQNWYYLYNVTIDGQTNSAVDPYAFDTAVNGTRGMIVNLPATNPKGWAKDKHVTVKNPVDASVYEADVRDFSIDPNSGVKPAYRGKYMAFTQTGTKGSGGVSTGIASVKQLGVKDVELMPTYEFASVDETNNSEQNWGYDPRNYNTPEGQYATNPHGTARISQYKSMVEAIHKSGMGVIFDGVYTHVADANTFNPLVNEYYLRTDDNGNYINGTGAGPDLAIERPMVEKFVEDSMKYWVEQYHVDGFRLDWMSLFGRTPMKKISKDLHKILPGIVIFGEPWLSSGDANTQNGVPAPQQINEGTQQGLGVAVLNDHFRNAICCAAFDTNAAYATGNPHEQAAAGNNLAPTRDAFIGVKSGAAGSIKYNSTIHDFAAAPSETLNYASNHDGYTLWDRINDFTDKSDSMATKESMDEFAQAIIFTAQGMPEMLSGEELLRSKQDSNNSFNLGDAVNEIDWSRKSTYKSVFAYYAGLIHLRAAHPAFRMTTAAEIRKNLKFLSSPDPTIVFELNGSAARDSWSHVVVMYNPTTSSASLRLPAGSWKVVGTTGHIGLKTLRTVSGSVSVPAYTAEVLHT